MSLNRENVTWELPDGRYAMAFFSFCHFGSEDEGFDPEWDVEYDYGVFEDAAAGATPDGAWEAATRNRANPGGTTVYTRASDLADCKRFDAMLASLKERQRRRHSI